MNIYLHGFGPGLIVYMAKNCNGKCFLESLQNVRKHRTIQADKLRSVECAYLANYITDYHHNKRKHDEQKKMFEKEFGHVERDSLWRGKCSIKK